MLNAELERAAPDKDSILTIGVFDGVHRGHQRLIKAVVDQARESNRLAGVITFSNHPATVLRPNFDIKYLTTLDERVRLITELGADFVLPITFDEELSRLDVRDFVTRVQSRLNMTGLVIGPDFAMGHNRKGDSIALSAIGEELGFTVQVVNLMVDEGHAVKSTAIRNLLVRGDVSGASDMLGRTYSFSGEIVTGMRRGRTLGYPTANLNIPAGMATPANGIYATWASIDGERHMAATNVGTRPTFDDAARTIEAFILDFNENVYGKDLCLQFMERQRDELRFESVDALLEQMASDVNDTRDILKNAPPTSC